MFNMMATVNVSVMMSMSYHADDCADDNGDDCNESITINRRMHPI